VGLQGDTNVSNDQLSPSSGLKSESTRRYYPKVQHMDISTALETSDLIWVWIPAWGLKFGYKQLLRCFTVTHFEDRNQKLSVRETVIRWPWTLHSVFSLWVWWNCVK
jgi:hypothetical protein